MIVENHLLGLVKLAIQHANRSNLVNPTGKALSLEAILVAILRSVVPSPDVAAGVADLLPSSNNLRLDELTLVLQQQAIIHYRRKTERAAERLAHALKKLSVKQHDLGELQEAQSSIREAAEILAGLMGPRVAAPPSDLNRRLKLAAPEPTSRTSSAV